MVGRNPVFDRLDKQLDEQRYAGFGQAPRQAQQAQQAPHASQGQMSPPSGLPYAATDAVTTDRLQDMYDRPSAGSLDTGRITLDDVIVKSLTLFAVLLAAAGVTWVTVLGNETLAPPIYMAGMIGGLILGLVIAFKKTVSVPLIVLYSALEGAFLGAFTYWISSIPQYRGVALQAVLATLCTFAAMYAGYATGFIKVTNKMRRMFFFAIVGYMIFGLLQLVLVWTGVLDGWGFGGSGALGIGLSLLGVGLAAFSLAFDFDSIDHAITVGAPKKFAWLLAHGLIVSLVWLYIEFIRLFARLQDN